MNRGKYSKPIDCAECGAPIRMFEDFDHCDKCGATLHIGCAVWYGTAYICPECKPKETDE